MEFLYNININQDFITVYSTKILTREVNIAQTKNGKWEINHFSHRTENIQDVRNYLELINLCCNIADDLNSENADLVETTLMDITYKSEKSKGYKIN